MCRIGSRRTVATQDPRLINRISRGCSIRSDPVSANNGIEAQLKTVIRVLGSSAGFTDGFISGRKCRCPRRRRFKNAAALDFVLNRFILKDTKKIYISVIDTSVIVPVSDEPSSKRLEWPVNAVNRDSWTDGQGGRNGTAAYGSRLDTECGNRMR